MGIKRDKTAIKGEEYTITRTETGWTVTKTEHRIDRITHSHQVVAASNGCPASCTCPDQFHRGGVCKHMNAVLALYSPGEPG